jgi:Domain of unknown function (DUF1707)/Cell wall-active antibiotics response 4TMS YvqF
VRDLDVPHLVPYPRCVCPADNNWMDPQTFNPNSRLRASDQDRERAASVLNEALAEGRLTAQEHSERLDSIYAAKTHAELAPLLEDLPAPSGTLSPTAVKGDSEGGMGRWAGGGGVGPVARRDGRIVAIFGGASRKGAWRAPATSTVVTVFGGADIDLRDAILPTREITIRAFSVFGGMSITVPPDMRVIDSGVAIFGGRDVSGNSAESERPDSPVLRLAGACVFGGISVKHKNRKPKRKAIP